MGMAPVVFCGAIFMFGIFVFSQGLRSAHEGGMKDKAHEGSVAEW